MENFDNQEDEKDKERIEKEREADIADKLNNPFPTREGISISDA